MRAILGEGAGFDKEVRILNRVVRIAEGGLLYESDPRHAEMPVRALDIKNSAATPGDKTIPVDPDASLDIDAPQEEADETDEHDTNVLCSIRIRSVHFNEQIETHDVQYYSTMYGQHPGSSVFDKHGEMKALSEHADSFTGKSSCHGTAMEQIQTAA